MISDSHRYTVQTVEQAFDLLEAISEKPDSATLPYLADHLGLSRHKVFRLLATLESMGLVERGEQSGHYQLGHHSIEIAHKFMKNLSVIRYSRPVMETLEQRLDEAVYLALLKGSEVLFADMVDTDQQIKTTSLVGQRLPFFTNAAGKVMKAFDSRDLVEKFFSRNRKSPDAIDLSALEAELNAIRTTGVAIETGGLGEGITSVAVAVRDYAGKVIGALTVLGPSFRMLSERIEREIVPSMLESAALLSEKFGYARG